MGNDRLSSAYVTKRIRPVGRGIPSSFRWSKIAVSKAITLTEDSAKRVLKSLKRQDPHASYAIIAI